MTANVIASLNKRVKPSPKPILPIGWHCFTTLLAVQTYNLSYESLMQTYQLHYLESRTSFFSVLLKLTNVTFAELFT